MSTEWRNVKGYEGHYQVSRSGQVRSLKRGLRVMRPSTSRTGYPQLNLYRDGKVKHFYVHRLVAEAFIGPIPDGYEVNHKDGSKTNANADNLEIVTARQNIRHAIEMGLIPSMRGEQGPRAKLKEQQVREIRRLKGRARVKDVAATYGVSPRSVYLIWQGVTWRHVV